MNKVIINVFTCSIFASFLGSILLFIGLLTGLVVTGAGTDTLSDAIGKAFIFYFATAISVCLLSLFFAGPIYVVLNKCRLANYYTSFSLGFLIPFGSFGFAISYWNFIGGIIGILFHYHYVKSPCWFCWLGRYLEKKY